MPEWDKIRQRSTHLPLAAGNKVGKQPDEILTIDEVAAFLKAGKRTVYRLAASGEIPAFKLGGTWRFRRSELDEWIAESIQTKKKPDER